MKIGVSTPVQRSQYGTPVFITPKKEGTERFITEYRRLNHKLVRKPYTLPRIGETIQHLEVLQYATVLYLSMGYYNISIPPASQDMTTIVTKFGKFRYNRLHMGVCASGYTLQAKVYELLGDIKGLKTYIDDILVSIKDLFRKHIEQPRIILGRFSAAGLKVNALKFSFGLKEITYLGYVIKREGIKPEPNKVQGIIYIRKPDTTTKVRALIGMVHYYMDMWPRRSHVLTPLTDAASGPKGKEIL